MAPLRPPGAVRVGALSLPANPPAPTAAELGSPRGFPMPGSDPGPHCPTALVRFRLALGTLCLLAPRSLQHPVPTPHEPHHPCTTDHPPTRPCSQLAPGHLLHSGLSHPNPSPRTFSAATLATAPLPTTSPQPPTTSPHLFFTPSLTSFPPTQPTPPPPHPSFLLFYPFNFFSFSLTPPPNLLVGGEGSGKN